MKVAYEIITMNSLGVAKNRIIPDTSASILILKQEIP